MRLSDKIARGLTGCKGRLALGLGGVSLTVLLCVGVYVSQIAAGELADAGGETLFVSAKSAADLLAMKIREREQEIDLLRFSPALIKGDLGSAEIRQALNQRKRAHDEYAWIGVADANGKVIQATEGLLVGEQVEQRPWFRAAVQGDLYTGDIHDVVLPAKQLAHVDSGQPMRFIDFSAPIIDAEGHLKGVLGAHARWSWVAETVESVLTERTLQGGSEVMIADRNGAILYPWVHSAKRLPEAASSTTHYAMQQWDDGREYLTSIVPVNETTATKLGWRIVLRQPVAAATAPIEAQRPRLIGLSLLTALALTLLGYRFATRICLPIKQLSKTLRDVERGNRAPVYPATRHIPEIGQLISTIASMTKAFFERERELEERNVLLGKLVNERTESLSIANSELERLATHDALTGANNRRRLDERLREYFVEMQRTRSDYALLIVDVDHFKQINDTFGHDAGDSVLKQLAVLLEEDTRETDFVARYGGEEFVVILPNARAAEGEIVAEKLRSAVAALFIPEVGGITVSIGMSSSDMEDTAETTVLHRADAALYAAKRNGRNRVETLPASNCRV